MMRAPRVALVARQSAFQAAVVAACLAVYLTTPQLPNAWTIIDDHEILGWIGTSERLPLSAFAETLATTEVGSANVAARFRPVYYGLRIATAVVAGKHVGAWYVIHSSLLASTVFLLLYAGFRFFARSHSERILVLAATMLAFGRAYWADIFARLGPSEAYGAVGFGMVAVGVLARCNGHRDTKWYVVLATGAVVAAGSKENLLILALPLCVVVALDFRTASTTVRMVLAAAAVLLLSEAIVVLRTVASTGQDVYGQSTSLPARLRLLADFARRPEARLCSGVTTAFVATAGVFRIVGFRESHYQVTKLFQTGLLLCGVWFLAATQYAFYNGAIPANSRYDFPYWLLFDVGALAVLIVTFRLLISMLNERFRLPLLVLEIAVAVGITVNALPRVADNKATIDWVRREHLTFDTSLARALATIRESRPSGIVLNAHGAASYEPLFSIATHLRSASVTIPIYIEVATDSERGTVGDWERGLLRELRELSTQGSGNIQPLPRELGNCYSFGINGPPLNRCNAGTQIWPIPIG